MKAADADPPSANKRDEALSDPGTALVCVRYRYHSERQRRIKTVELIEEEQPRFASGALYLVKIGWDEAALRERLKMAGARRLPARKLWKPQEPSPAASDLTA